MANPFAQFKQEDVQAPAPVLAGDPPAAPENPFEAVAPPPPPPSPAELDAMIRKDVLDPKVKIGDILNKYQPGFKPEQQKVFRDVIRRVRKDPGQINRVNFNFDNGATSKEVAPDAVKRTPIERNEVASFLRSAGNMLSFNTADNAASALIATGGEIGDMLGLTEQDQTWYQRYVNDQRRQAATIEDDYNLNPKASYGGAGVGLAAQFAIPVTAIGRIGATAKGVKGYATRTAVAAPTGAAMSVVDAAGSAAPGQEFDNAGTAAAIGAAGGVVAEPVVRAGGKALNWAAERFGIAGLWDKVSPEVRAAATRLKPTKADIQRMRDEATRFAQNGRAPRLIDAMSRRERDFVAAGARRDTPARDVAYDAATADSRNLGTNLTEQFDRVTDVRGNARQIGGKVEERRKYNADLAMNEMRDDVLTVDQRITDVLSSKAGQRAWQNAIDVERNPEVAAAMGRLPAMLEQTAGLGPAARLQALRQSGSFTVGMADTLRRKLGDMIESARRNGENDLAANLTRMKNDVTDAAQSANPKYKDYLREYGEDSRTLRAIETGGELFDRNTDEFADAAGDLSKEGNVVMKDQPPVEGNYEVLTSDKWGRGSARETFRVKLDDGRYITFDLTIPERGGRNTIAGFNIKSSEGGYGEQGAFNKFGPRQMRDLERWVTQHVAREYPHVTGVSGHRVGGVRAAAQTREYARQNEEYRARIAARQAAEQEANITPEYDAPDDAAGEFVPDPMATPPAGSFTAAEQRMIDNYERYSDDYDMADDYMGSFRDFLDDQHGHLREEVREAIAANMFRGQRTRTPPSQTPADDIDMDPDGFSSGITDRTNIGGNENRGRVALDFGEDPVNMRGDIWEEYETFGGNDNIDEFAAYLEGAYAHISPETRARIVDAVRNDRRDGPSLWDDETGSKRISAGLPPETGRRYREITGQGDFDDAERFANVDRRTNGTPTDPSQRRRITDLGMDESGMVRIRMGRDTPPEPPVASSIPHIPQGPGSPRNTQAKLGGIKAVGQGGRRDRSRPADLPATEGFASTRPLELNAPSDQQLAVLAARRRMEAKMGESANGPHQMGNAMAYAPEQLARNEALMGPDVAGELQQAMDVQMSAVANSRQVSPATGSGTALRSGDDEAMGNAAQVAANFMGGPKAGIMSTTMQFMKSKLGMRDQDVEAFVTRSLDPQQTNVLIDELERALGGDRNTAIQIMAALRADIARIGGQAAAPMPEEQ